MNALRWLFFALVVRPLVGIVMGLNIRHRERLPAEGPVVLAANHNSHLDTLVLMSLFPFRLLPRLRPVAAADFFCRGGLRERFARGILNIIPLERKPRPGTDPLAEVDAALGNGDIVILFPEGTRGEPETFKEFRTGIAHVVKRRPDVPVVPVFLHGLGKALPRGEAVLVPFFCDVFIGEPLRWTGDRDPFMAVLEDRFRSLAAEGPLPPWE
jgi:1-acyl-sn-glycerol-3-phosphate acyltransferase